MFGACFKARLCAAGVCAGVLGVPRRSCCAFVAQIPPQGHPPVQDRIWARLYSANARSEVADECLGGEGGISPHLWLCENSESSQPCSTSSISTLSISGFPTGKSHQRPARSPAEESSASLETLLLDGLFPPPQYILGTVEAGKKTLLKITT